MMTTKPKMNKVERSYTVFQLDPDYYVDGSMRILEDKSCGHKHKTLRTAGRCCGRKSRCRDEKTREEWSEARIRENTSGLILCEDSRDDFRDRHIYRTKYIDGRLFFSDKKYPECPPDIALLFNWEYRNSLTPQELMVIDLKVINLPRNVEFDMPLDLPTEGLYRLLAYWKKIGVTPENPLGTKSMENTCGVCGKTGFKKKVNPKTLYTHNQKCNACGNSIMIDSWYFAKNFAGKSTGRRLRLVKGKANNVVPNHRNKIYIFLPSTEDNSK